MKGCFIDLEFGTWYLEFTSCSQLVGDFTWCFLSKCTNRKNTLLIIHFNFNHTTIMNEYSNLSPQEKREKEYKNYERFIALALIPLAIYLFWPFLFGQKDNAQQAEVIEERIEKIDERIEEEMVVETQPIEGTEIKRKITPPVAPPAPKRNNQIRNNPPTRKPATKPQNNNTFALTYNVGDKIEYITPPQNSGWRGVVTGKNNGNYTVRITEVKLANDKQQYLATNNPCHGRKPIGKNTVNQTIIVPGRCIHQK